MSKNENKYRNLSEALLAIVDIFSATET